MTDISPSTTSSTAPSRPSLLRRRDTVPAVLISVAVVESLSGVTQGYVIPILPTLGPVFGISDQTINLLFLLQSLAFAVITPLVSRLGDTFGYRRTLRCSVVVVSAGVLLMAVVPTLATVMIGAVLLTLVVGFIPLMMGILRSRHHQQTRVGVSVMVGVLLFTVGGGGLLAGIVGRDDPLLGFWVAVPFAIAALVCAWLLPDAGEPEREPIAIGPMALCSVGLIGVVLATSQGPTWGWLDVRTLLAALVGLGALAAWGRLDARTHSPRRYVDLRMLGVPQIRVVSLSTFFFGFGSVSYLGANGIFLHADPAVSGYGFGLDSLEIAVLFTGVTVLSMVASLLTTGLMDLVGERGVMVAAGVVLSIGFLVVIALHASLVGYSAGLACFGVGLGLYQASTRALAVEGLPQTVTATAAGINELALSIGIAIGAAVIQVFAAAFAEGGHIALRGFYGIWITLAIGSLVAAGAAWGYRRVTAATTEVL